MREARISLTFDLTLMPGYGEQGRSVLDHAAQEALGEALHALRLWVRGADIQWRYRITGPKERALDGMRERGDRVARLNAAQSGSHGDV